MDAYERNCGCHCQRCSLGRVTGGAMMVTVGILFLLSEFTRWDFGQTWPLLLVVLGVIQVYRHSASTEGHIEPGASPSVAPAPQNPEPPQVPHV